MNLSDTTRARSQSGRLRGAAIGALAVALALGAGCSNPSGLVYSDPEGGKIRLVGDASSTSSTIVLKLVAAQRLSGYSVGFNLALDATKVQPNSNLIAVGDALNPGGAPQAFRAVIPTAGTLASALTTALSQKASGAGAVPLDANISAGQTFFTIRLDAVPGAKSGVVFNGSSPGGKFSAALINKAGDDVVHPSEFGIGKLELF
jgi:hypothetical protein